MNSITNERNKQTDRLPLQARTFLETPEGQLFIRKQAKRACLITVFLFQTLVSLSLIISKHSNINYLHPKRDFVSVCLFGGFLLAYVTVKALFDQIVLNGLNARLELSGNERIPLPFQSLKIQIIAGLGALMIFVGLLESLIS